MKILKPDQVHTTVGSSMLDAERLRMRGRDVLEELLGKMSFSEAFYFIVTGRDLTPEQLRLFDACLIILMDRGITPHALVARVAHAGLPEDTQLPMIAGTMMVGNKFAGTLSGAGKLYREGAAYGGDKVEWAASVVQRFRELRKPVPGYGHPTYTDVDPRAERIIEIAAETGNSGQYVELARLLAKQIEAARGKPMVLNVTGALGAALNEIEFPVEVMRSVAAVSRAAGLVGHIYEEMHNPIFPAVVDLIGNIEYRDPE
ncbi:MAG: citryl-CoA lyase [Halieaceae bacterium]|nr:citryl-CoA lyase [Halieaceae bacterium]